MGKTHLSGLEIGDPSVGIWASNVQSLKVTATALNTGVPLSFPNGGLITEVRVVDNTGALVVGTIKLGTTNGGTEIFTGSSVAGTPLAVNKSVQPGANAWLQVSALTGTLPATVYITYIG